MPHSGGGTSKDSSFIVTALLQALGHHLTQFLLSSWLQTLHQILALCFCFLWISLQKIRHYNVIHAPKVNIIVTADDICNKDDPFFTTHLDSDLKWCNHDQMSVTVWPTKLLLSASL